MDGEDYPVYHIPYECCGLAAAKPSPDPLRSSLLVACQPPRLTLPLNNCPPLTHSGNNLEECSTHVFPKKLEGIYAEVL